MDQELSDRVQKEDVVLMTLGDTNSVVIHKHGATVLSWKCNGQEIIFLSKKAVFDNKKAIRGGIPLVFPQFGPWECGPQHGVARIKRWTLHSGPQENGDGSVSCAFALTDDENTRSMWDYEFKLIYTVTLQPTNLITSLSVNNTGSKDFTFTTLMHTYFYTNDISKTTIKGLKDLTYVDKVKGGDKFKEDRELVTIPENYDRVYENCPNKVDLITGNHGVTVETQNFTDVVVWNPWEDKAKAMGDFGDDEYHNMVCVEAGTVSEPVKIAVGKELIFSQTLCVKSNL